MDHPVIRETIEKSEAALGETGRMLVGPSGTERLLRIMAEAPTDELVNYHVDTIVKVVKEQIGLED